MSRSMRWVPVVLGAATAALLGSKRAAGQTSPGYPKSQTVQSSGPLSVSMQVGIAVTLGRLVSDSALVMRQVGAAALGIAADYRITPRMSVEATLAWTPSQVAVRDWQETVDLEAAMLLSSLRLRFSATPAQGYHVFVSPGIGLVDRHGEAWRNLEGARNAALVLGAGAVLSSASRFSYGLEMQSYITHGGYRDRLGTAFDARLRNDLLLSLSVRYAQGR